jgi:hypothetical protein
MRLLKAARPAPRGSRATGLKSDRHSGAIGLSLPRDHVPVTIVTARANVERQYSGLARSA